MTDQNGRSPTPGDLRAFWTAPFIAILIAHFIMDAFSGMIPASLGLLQKRWGLSDQQGALFLGIGSLCSGLAQPLFAWISDRADNRIFGGMGLAIVAVLLSSLGLASSALHLFMFYTFGMIGNGMFHPIAASTVGQINPVRRSMSVSCFFVAGMMGGIAGATFGPRLLVLEQGFNLLRWVAIPGLLAAIFLHLKIRTIPHRAAPPPVQSAYTAVQSHWIPVGLLYCSAAIRFMVNLALVYLYLRWTEAHVAKQFVDFTDEQVARYAAPLVGNINAASIAGMAVGGFCSGLFIPGGKEKWPLILLPMVFGPLVAMFPYAGPITGYFLAFGAGVGFASLVPVTITLAQRMMPGRTSLASGLVMGGAWAIAMFGPTLAEWLIHRFSIDTAFFVIAVLLAGSGLFVLPVKSSLIRGTVEPDRRVSENPISDTSSSG